MKIDVCSDLHVNAWYYEKNPDKTVKSYIDWDCYKNPDSTVLIIAGDTSNSIDDTLRVVEEASQQYELVVFVDGNHEHYHSQDPVLENQIRLQLACRAISPNIVYLCGNDFSFDHVLFTGGCGWYDWTCYSHLGIGKDMAMAAWEDMSNDYNYVSVGIPFDIKRDKIHPIEWLAEQHMLGIKKCVADANTNDKIKKVIVVTHTSPLEGLMVWKPRDMTWNVLTPSYVNSKMDQVWKQDHKISHWIYGHTHTPSVKEFANLPIKFVNNARGYPGELPNRYRFVQIEA